VSPCSRNTSSPAASAWTSSPTRIWAIPSCSGACATPTGPCAPASSPPPSAGGCGSRCRKASRTRPVNRGIHLTLMVGPVVPIPVPQTLLHALTPVEVTSNTDGPSGFQLTFLLSNTSPLQTIFLVAGAQTPMLRVIVVVTLNGTPQVLMDGVMTRQEVTAGTKPGEVQLRITGEDLTKAMDLIDFSGLPFPAMPVEARVLLTIAKYAVFGLIPLVIPTLLMDVPIPIERIPSQQGTDLQYLRLLAAEAGYVFYIEPGPVPGTNTAYWGP